jgi:hypothetical protein
MALTSSVPGLALGQTQPTSLIARNSNMKVEFSFSDFVFTASLYDNPSARDLASMMPLDLTIDDYSNNEKIAYLPRKLTEQGSGAFENESVGDLCYYAPWGNLVFYYARYRYSAGLIRLGRLDNGFEPLLTRGKFPLRARLSS